MTRFALLRHECPPEYRDGPHWDLMIERAGVAGDRRLATWSLLALPALWAERLGLADPGHAASVLATRLDDHRAAYLDYEGPVSGFRGHVARIAGGEAVWLERSATAIAVRLAPSNPLSGVVRLAVVADPRWRLATDPE